MTLEIGHEILYYNEVTSTNDILKEMAKNNSAHGLVLVASKQTKGRGRKGRTWVSLDENGLWFSILVYPQKAFITVPQTLTLILALAMAKTIQTVSDIPCEIKWPNDLVVGGKKLCGILCESQFQGNKPSFMIAGIGLNVNQENFSGELQDIAASLRMFTKKIHDKNVILKEFLKVFNRFFQEVSEGHFSELVNEYKKNLLSIGKRVKLTQSNDESFGKVLDISNEGALIVLLDDGRVREIHSGEVTLREVP